VLSLIEDVWVGEVGDRATRRVVSTTVAGWPDASQWICIPDMRMIGEPGRWRISRDRCKTWDHDFETSREALAFLEAGLRAPLPDTAALPQVARNWTCSRCNRALLSIMFVARVAPGERRGDFGAICPECSHEIVFPANADERIVRIDTFEARGDD
jgi:hypothetical protein